MLTKFFWGKYSVQASKIQKSHKRRLACQDFLLLHTGRENLPSLIVSVAGFHSV